MDYKAAVLDSEENAEVFQGQTVLQLKHSDVSGSSTTVENFIQLLITNKTFTISSFIPNFQLASRGAGLFLMK